MEELYLWEYNEEKEEEELEEEEKFGKIFEKKFHFNILKHNLLQ